MTRQKQELSSPQTDYTVMVEQRPYPVKARTMGEAIRKAKANARRDWDEAEEPAEPMEEPPGDEQVEDAVTESQEDGS